MTSFDDQASAWEWLRINDPEKYEQMLEWKISGVLERNCAILQEGFDRLTMRLAVTIKSSDFKAKVDRYNESVRRSQEIESIEDAKSGDMLKNSKY